MGQTWRRELPWRLRNDLDALLGYVAAEANHCKDRKLQKELDELFERLQKTMEGYDDGAWQEAF